MLPAFHSSASEMLRNWEEKLSPEGSCELDVWPYLQTLTGDVISRTAFGSNYEEGRKILELQQEQVDNVVTAERSLYIPGMRYAPGFNLFPQCLKNIFPCSAWTWSACYC